MFGRKGSVLSNKYGILTHLSKMRCRLNATMKKSSYQGMMGSQLSDCVWRNIYENEDSAILINLGPILQTHMHDTSGVRFGGMPRDWSMLEDR